MSSPARVLNGINNSMPGPGAGGGGRGYVILGGHATWASAPTTLALDGGSFPVVKEAHDFMCRGLDLKGGDLFATVTCEDGSGVDCKITVENVC